jgi:uncharacterized protein involved in exopolysaccharide biosynthesis
MAQDDDEEEGGSGVPPLDLAKSYGAYTVRALRQNVKFAALTASAVVALTVGVVAVWPRTFVCTTVLSAMDNKVLDGERGTDALRNASDLILNHENIANIVKETKLTESWERTLPPISRFKQSIMVHVRGEVPENAKRDALIGMVESSIGVDSGWGSRLTISAGWTDPKVAADLAAAAAQSFLRAREVAEISTIKEYIEILEGHANELRKEIQSLANQSQATREERAAAAQEMAEKAASAQAGRAAAGPRPMAVGGGPREPAVRQEDLTELKANLEAKTRSLKELEDTRARRLAEAEATLTELRSKVTAAHPMTQAAEANIRSLSQDTPQLLSLRSEVASLTATLKSKQAAEELVAKGGPRVAFVPPSAGVQGAPSVEPLPAEVMRLLQEDSEELDPAIAAQFRGTVNKYAALRDSIGTARLDLDRAQAAFRHRYQVVVPAEPPGKPAKPKVPLILAAGVGAALVLGWLVAIVAQLRRGRMLERWQVYNLGIPLLGEVRWPPSSES